ncbi:unnamed protein product [Spirodela intermedia]|uniref:2-phytyl-1,4-beta-naphthoquinone methyltransferase, chloroplastic n=1 Tax=Spirodela intermedia TaxID=51605 RepID=A0A7I8JPT5_SPIIN|nr:unnamed protein product [Spirodela intermedia]CAA6671442.1 unnamed protein product [Spirodela intermedia]
MASISSLSQSSQAAAASFSPGCRRLRSRRSTPAAQVFCSAERQALFSRIAPVYDDPGLHRVWKRMAVSWSGAKKGDRVLDLCCGSGDLAFLLSERVGPEGEVTGLDFSSKQLLIASSRQNLSGKASIEILREPLLTQRLSMHLVSLISLEVEDAMILIQWVEGDALNLSFPACYFDAMTIGYGLRNLVDKRKAMEEMFEISVLDFNKSTSAFTTIFQEYMIDNVVVPVASSYGLSEEYAYLKASIQEFLTGQELEELARGAGFSDAKHYEISGGLMGNLVPPASQGNAWKIVYRFIFTCQSRKNLGFYAISGSRGGSVAPRVT